MAKNQAANTRRISTDIHADLWEPIVQAQVERRQNLRTILELALAEFLGVSPPPAAPSAGRPRIHPPPPPDAPKRGPGRPRKERG